MCQKAVRQVPPGANSYKDPSFQAVGTQCEGIAAKHKWGSDFGLADARQELPFNPVHDHARCVVDLIRTEVGSEAPVFVRTRAWSSWSLVGIRTMTWSPPGIRTMTSASEAARRAISKGIA